MNTPADGEYGAIRVAGEDAAAFLQAQLTNSVEDMAVGATRLAAWCSAKGRVLALFRVLRLDDGFALRLPRSLAPGTLARLKMFVLRSRVDLAETPDGGGPSRLQDVLAGIPQVYAETRDQFVPQMLNLQALGAIDFRKGCYPGQEIVARAQYRGEVKRRMFLAAAEVPIPPAPGASVIADGAVSGTVVDAAEDAGRCLMLVVLPIEAAESARWIVEGSDAPLTLQPLPYTV